MKPRPQFYLTLAITIFLAYFIWEAREWRLQARLYPWTVGIPILVLALVQLVLDLKGIESKKSSDEAPVDFQFTRGVDSVLARGRTINIFSWILGFLLGIWLFSFALAVPLMVFLYLKVQSHEGWGLSLTLTGASWLLFWGLFDRLLRLPFPEAQLFVWLGLFQ